MKQPGIYDNPYYKSLTRNMIPTVVIVSFTPMILVSLVILYHFQVSYTEKVKAHLKELVLKHKQDIDTFLAEETSDLSVLSKNFDIEQLRNQAFLEKELFVLQSEHRGAFVDIGLINNRGRQVAYAGPFKLGRADYSDSDWFNQAITRDVFVSDVFLGLRGLPHFIISVKKEVNGQPWILRATIDFVSFNNLVENIRIGETGFALIINRKNEFQTNPRFNLTFGKVLYDRFLDETTRDKDGVQILEHKDGTGDGYIYVSSFLKNGEWLLVYRQNTSDAFSIIRRAQNLAMLIFVIGGLGIITMAVFFSRRMVGFIARADREKEMMNHQMIETGKLASIGELASGVAHEINNPVAIMMEEAGWLQDLLEDNGLQGLSAGENLEEFNRALNQIRTQGGRCKEITHKLLSFARKTESGSQKVDIGELVREILDLTRQRTKYSHVDIETAIADSIPCIRASRTELQQILLNLVNNAIDAMENTGGTVTVECCFVSDHIHIIVSDTGPGIPESNLPRIFDPFFTTKPVGKGTGLGLSICYGIIRKMGGDIKVQSTLNRGTAFDVRLPVQIATTPVPVQCAGPFNV